MTLSRLLLERARRRGRALAFTNGREALTWADTSSLAQLVARAMPSSDIRVALCGDCGLKSLAYVSGMLSRGAEVALFPHLDLGRTQQLVASWAADIVVSVEPRPTRHIIDTELAAITRGSVGRSSSSGPNIVFATSGSTAAPRLVTCAEDKVIGVSEVIADALDIRGEDTLMSIAPPFFDYGFNQFMLALVTGAALHYAGGSMAALRATPGELPTVSVLSSTPDQLQALALRPFDDARSETVRTITSTGAPFPIHIKDEILRRWPNAQVRPMYGMTECKRISIGSHAEFLTDPRTVGRPLPGTEVEADAETQELMVRSPFIMDFADDGRTDAPRMVEGVAGRWLATGDSGIVHDDGRIQVLGRLSQFVKISGARVSLAECEAVLRSAPGIIDAAIADAGGRLVAWCQLEGPDHQPDRRELARSLVEWFGVPALLRVDLRFLADLPRLPNGKVDRATLAAGSAEVSADDHHL